MLLARYAQRHPGFSQTEVSAVARFIDIRPAADFANEILSKTIWGDLPFKS
jgi:hypothetical protein